MVEQASRFLHTDFTVVPYEPAVALAERMALFAEIREQGLGSRMLLQVHDELVFEVPPAELDTMRALVRTHMEGAAELAVPLVVDVGVGPNWLEAKR